MMCSLIKERARNAKSPASGDVGSVSWKEMEAAAVGRLSSGVF
jgi:hypothetical protein